MKAGNSCFKLYVLWYDVPYCIVKMPKDYYKDNFVIICPNMDSEQQYCVLLVCCFFPFVFKKFLGIGKYSYLTVAFHENSL